MISDSGLLFWATLYINLYTIWIEQIKMKDEYCRPQTMKPWRRRQSRHLLSKRTSTGQRRHPHPVVLRHRRLRPLVRSYCIGPSSRCTWWAACVSPASSEICCRWLCWGATVIDLTPPTGCCRYATAVSLYFNSTWLAYVNMYVTKAMKVSSNCFDFVRLLVSFCVIRFNPARWPLQY